MSLSTLGLMRSVYPKPASPPPKSWPSTPIKWSLQGRPLREATTAMATTWFDPPLWKSCPSTPHLCKLQCQGTSPRPSSNQKAPITVTGAHFYHCPGFLLFSKIHKSRFSLFKKYCSRSLHLIPSLRDQNFSMMPSTLPLGWEWAQGLTRGLTHLRGGRRGRRRTTTTTSSRIDGCPHTVATSPKSHLGVICNIQPLLYRQSMFRLYLTLACCMCLGNGM